MKQARFRLQSVLDYRTEQLNLAQQRVAEEESKRVQILRTIQESDAFIEQAFRDQQRALTETVLDTTRLQGFPDYLWRLKQERFQQFQRLQAQEQKLRQVREELRQTLFKQKSLETLKDKDAARQRKRIEKAEEDFLSEIALNRHIRQEATA